ncbi:response regulator [Ruminococcus sp. OA3]|uniref:response regulator transcription factor n=1 Tax=Ruminococcus sp. OA3 TaxID=2914164 RepID=UPI001F05B64B|nr:response regulator [Ruminococcus sp. OA3]MCH1982056.1 response regulator [Ruminococcus sp. OA3]
MGMKVIIVDDEKKICQLIQFLVDWEKMGLEVAGVAYNGIDALRLVEELEPAIIITDIKMPGCDGLELIQQVQHRKPNIHFIIISGYQDFEYARKAIRYGVRDYLSKPIQKDELEETLQRVAAERLENQEHEQNVNILRSKVQQQSTQIKQTLLKNLVNQEQDDLQCQDLEAINNRYHCDFQQGCFRVLLVKPDFEETEEYELIYRQITRKISEISRKEFKEECFDIITYEHDLGTYVLLNYPTEGIQEFRWQLKHIRVNTANLHEIFQEIHVTVGIGRQVEDFRQIGQSLTDAKSAILNRICLGIDKIIGVDEESEAKVFDPYTAADTDFKSCFLEMVDMYDLDGIARQLEVLGEICKSRQECDGNSIYLALRELFGLVVLQLKKNKISGSEEWMPEEFQNVFYHCTSVNEVFQRFLGLIQRIIEKEIEENRMVEIKPIKLVKSYIQNHYAQPIKLEEMSEMAGFNSAYFSTMFKKETGQTLTEYILQVRMDKAKELLKNKEIKINDIPELIGVGDAKYFSKQFKKVSGLTPSQYRRFFG